ncbi:MAG: GntR family transcriptional regulator [Xanthobacteraceae bacterium]
MEQPRYMQILNVLSQRVETGRYPLEERLPTESELCDEFAASRFTVREALRRLVDHGMVRRRQGAGSIVVAASPKARYVHSLSSLADLSQFALDTHYDLISSSPTKLPAGVAAQIGGKAGSRWWLLTGLRRAELRGSVICYMHTYLPERLSRYVRELADCVGPFHAHLAKRTGEDIVEIEQDLHGEPMGKDVASNLGQKPGTISVCALRRYMTRKGTLVASYNWHVAQDFHYRMKLSRDG